MEKTPAPDIRITAEQIDPTVLGNAESIAEYRELRRMQAKAPK
jgi:hypothetical protein